MPRSSSDLPTPFRWPLVVIGGLIFYALTVVAFAMAGHGPFLDWLASLPPWPAAAIKAIPMLLLGAFIATVPTRRALRRHMCQLTDALDNMSQALCVVDSGLRLTLYNQRYVELCNLPPGRLWPGRPFRDVLEERRTVGTFVVDSDKYIAECVRRAAEGKQTQSFNEYDGKSYLVLERPMPGGGWLMTLVDITQARKADSERAAMVEQEQRRSAVDDAILSFRTQVERMLKTVTDNAGTMRATATRLFTSSHQTSERVEGAVQTSNEASVNVESAAFAADELSSSVAEISRQLSQTNDVVRNAAKEAQATNNEIGGLAASAQKIGDVVKMIQDIAGQTNLLALNATIEAARAGEAGRGFAVVASEVKSLAVQTAKATEEIASQIAAVQGSSTEVVQAIRLLAERMQEINHYSSAVAASLHQQNAATGEISQNVASAAKGTKALAATLGEVAGTASETSRSAQTVLAASEAVESAADSLRAEVQSFLEKVAV